MVRPSARNERQPHAQRLRQSGLSPELLRQAAQQALRRGLVTRGRACGGRDRPQTVPEASQNDPAPTPPEAFQAGARAAPARSSAKTGAEFARKRQLLVFDRFLARIVAVLGDAATLKGGSVLELRLERARTTKDVDLRMVGSPDDVLAKLQEPVARTSATSWRSRSGRTTTTRRSRTTGCSTTGFGSERSASSRAKLYGQPALASTSRSVTDPRRARGRGRGGRARVRRHRPADAAALPDRDAHRGEAARAYTMPRATELAREGPARPRAPGVGAGARRQRLRALPSSRPSPSARRTLCPARCPRPSRHGARPTRAMAREDQLRWTTLDDVTAAAKAFLDPVLAGGSMSRGGPTDWRWG